MYSPASEYLTKGKKLSINPEDNDVDTPTIEKDFIWKNVRPYYSTEQIDDVLPFKNYMAIFGRENGIQKLWIMKMSSINDINSNDPIDDITMMTADWHAVSFPEVVYSIWAGDNYIYDSNVLRLGYSSLLTPKQVVEYNM